LQQDSQDDVMHDCLPFLQQLREQALQASSDADDDGAKVVASTGKMRDRDSIAQQCVTCDA